MRLSFFGVAAFIIASVPSVSAGPIQWSSAVGGNDHYYEFVDTTHACGKPNGYDCLTWDDALAAAATFSYQGMQGYLATEITTGEAVFVRQNTGVGNLHAWIAGSDEGDDGNYTWRAGPETGLSFLKYDFDTHSFNCLQEFCDGGAYVLSSEVNYLMLNATPFGVDWLLNTVDDHFPGFPSQGFGRPVAGYIVEYGGDSPEPGTMFLFAAGGGALVVIRRRRFKG